YLIRRFFLMLLTLFGISVLVFTMLRVVPGNIADILFDAAGMIDTAEKAKLEKELGLDQPIAVQYVQWIGGLARGDLGYSYVSEKPAIDEILPRIPITAKLAGLALLFAIVFGVPLGVISAVKQNSGLDYVLRVISLSGLSMPSFWLGLLILMAFVKFFGTIPIYSNAPGGFWAALGLYDEYWSPPERVNVTAARDAGVNLAFLGANAMFRRTRLEPTALGTSRLVVCYRTSYQQDPMYGVDNTLVTSDWREAPHPDPESSVIGTLYEGYPTVADYVVAAPDAWMFKGTGARKGTRFAALVGIEYDRVNPGSPLQRPIQILAHSPLTCNGVNSYADSAYYTHRSGAGVFNAGTMRWVESFGPPLYGWGITRRCGEFTRRVTANVLRAFADGPAAHSYPAHDN